MRCSTDISDIGPPNKNGPQERLAARKKPSVALFLRGCNAGKRAIFLADDRKPTPRPAPRRIARLFTNARKLFAHLLTIPRFVIASISHLRRVRKPRDNPCGVLPPQRDDRAAHPVRFRIPARRVEQAAHLRSFRIPGAISSRATRAASPGRSAHNSFVIKSTSGLTYAGEEGDVRGGKTGFCERTLSFRRKKGFSRALS